MTSANTSGSDPENDPRIEHVAFQPGDILFNEGDEEFHFFVIQDGDVEIFKKDLSGSPVQLGVVGPGSSLGEFAMLDRSPRSATARALTAVSASRVSEDAYKQLIEELPDWAVAVMRGMIDRLRATNEIVRRHGIAATSAVQKQMAIVEFDPNAPDPLDEIDSPFLSTNE